MCTVVETPFVCLPYVGVDHNLPAPYMCVRGSWSSRATLNTRKTYLLQVKVGTLLGVWNSTFLDTPVIS